MANDIRERMVRVEDKIDFLCKSVVEDRADRKELCVVHNRRLTDLEGWRNKLVGAYAIALAYLGMRHRL